MNVEIDPLLALGVVAATAATDAVYVFFTSAVIARRRVPAANWSSVWYMLSSFAVITYTQNWLLRLLRGGRVVARRVCVDDVSAWDTRSSAGATESRPAFLNRARARYRDGGFVRSPVIWFT